MPSLEVLMNLHTAAAHLTCDLSDLYVATSADLSDADADNLYAAVMAASMATREIFELIQRNYAGGRS